MSTPETPAMSAQEAADMKAVMEYVITRKPLDPEVARRVRERAEQLTEQLRAKYGEMNIAVDLIREIRGND
jgi:hypothetical protein